MRAALAVSALVVVFALGFLYIGTTHRDRCLRAGEDGCTILPWSGHPASGGSGWGGGRGWGSAVIP